MIPLILTHTFRAILFDKLLVINVLVSRRRACCVAEANLALPAGEHYVRPFESQPHRSVFPLSSQLILFSLQPENGLSKQTANPFRGTTSSCNNNMQAPALYGMRAQTRGERVRGSLVSCRLDFLRLRSSVNSIVPDLLSCLLLFSSH
jgi:hypothetical protein